MRIRFLVLACLVVLAAIPGASVHAAPRCFAEVPDCIDGRIASFWAAHGGLSVFGLPIGPQQLVNGVQTQLFERNRLELHPENAAPYDVLLGRLGAETLAARGRDWQTEPKADPSTPHYFAQTGHAVAPEFWAFYSSHGLEFNGQRGIQPAESLALFGLPLTEPQQETNPSDGKAYLTQWFERARFEYHPENATPYDVLLGLLGRETSSQPSSGNPIQIPGPNPTPARNSAGGFVSVSGSQLTLNGQQIMLKGVNYYPQGRPWKAMWHDWDGQQVERELRQARDDLGINAVRVLVPYNVDDTPSRAGVVSANLLAHMREMTQIAGKLDIKLIVTLFDFEDGFPAPNSRDDQRQLGYLRTLIGNFAGDDRILAWDLHNEPDNYLTWRNGNPGAVLAWLGRTADEVHRLAPSQLVTVGMAHFDNLLLRGPDGRRPIDYSDFVGAHIYDRHAVGYQLDVLRLNTDKPLVLEEFGWATANSCIRKIYNEDEQATVYRETIAAAQGKVAGMLAWTLRDYDAGATMRWDTHEEHYGLYRVDGSRKPAADLLGALVAAPLPSVVDSDLPLSSAPSYTPGGDNGPLKIDGTPFYVKAQFRLVWESFGGQGSFGVPLSDAVVIPGAPGKNDRVTQYFTAGVLELHPAAAQEPDFPFLSPPEKLQRLIIPKPIGTAYITSGGTFRAASDAKREVASAFRGFYRGIDGKWRLGQPISDAMTEQVNGKATTVQYFERGRLQLNPDTGTPEVGNLGELALQAQCRDAAP